MTEVSSSSGPPPAIAAVFAAVRDGELDSAKRLAVEALARGVEHPVLLNLRALAHEEAGRLEAALADLRRAHFLAPADYSVLNACGLALTRLERHEEGRACFERAVALEARFTPAWFNLGWTLERLGEMAAAVDAYQRAVTLEPSHAAAWANLAFVAARRGDAGEARRCAERALALQPGAVTAECALAEIELRTAPSQSHDRLERLLARADLGDLERGLADSLLGDALDALDRPADAFAAYARGNHRFARDAQARFQPSGASDMDRALAWMTPWAEALPPWPALENGSEAGGGDLPRSHVFLFGFARSGTTLAETVLAAQPDVVTLEERGTLDAAVKDFLVDRAAADRLVRAGERDIAAHRDEYWRRVAAFGARPAGKVFVDKNPFNALKLPLIQKLFPRARILFTIRDPRDVVLSCFRRRFILNASTYEFLDLGRAARFYAASMRFADVMAAKRDMPTHVLRFEAFVDDFTVEAAALCAFVGAAEPASGSEHRGAGRARRDRQRQRRPDRPRPEPRGDRPMATLSRPARPGAAGAGAVGRAFRLPAGRSVVIAQERAEALKAAADAAMRAGDPARARGLFEQASAADPTRLEVWIGLASACRAGRDGKAAIEALDRALALEPRCFPALLMKASMIEAGGRQKAAAKLYQNALAVAPPVGDMPDPMRRAIERARDVVARHGAAMSREIRAALGPEAPESPDPEDRRLDAFIEAIAGRRRIYNQEPVQFHYPNLPAIEFHDRAAFPWLAALEARTPAIRAELLSVWREGTEGLTPYVDYPDGSPLDQWAELNRSLNWTAFHLWRDGARVEANCRRCPATMEAIALIDQPWIAGRSPAAMFSILKPRTRIPPHTGIANTRLVLHLPLIVPAGCGFRVGGETRAWREGEAFVFDDTIQHEAWNDSDQPRAVLICDVWAPALSPREREQISAVMTALDRFEVDRGASVLARESGGL